MSYGKQQKRKKLATFVMFHKLWHKRIKIYFLHFRLKIALTFFRIKIASSYIQCKNYVCRKFNTVYNLNGKSNK